MTDRGDRYISAELESFLAMNAHVFGRVIGARGLLSVRSNTDRQAQASFVWQTLERMDAIVARGKKQAVETNGGGLPTFVEVKLDPEQRAAFLAWELADQELLGWLAKLMDDGIRVGVSWSGEQQSYIVSLTGREGSGVNKGLCMTSFSKTLKQGLMLAIFKHVTVTGGDWRQGEDAELGSFG